MSFDGDPMDGGDTDIQAEGRITQPFSGIALQGPCWEIHAMKLKVLIHENDTLDTIEDTLSP